MRKIATSLSWIVWSLVGVGMIGLVDYATGSEFGVFPLYYLPVSLGAWHAGWPATLALATISSGVWLLSNSSDATPLESPLVLAVNFMIQMIAAGCVGALVTVLRQRLNAERDLSRRDSLTGLPNRRAFYERAELLLAAARRYAHPVTVAYLDLDDFKAVNDEHGHTEGDLVLRLTGDVIQRETRAADLAARLGGDEFILLLVETEAKAAAVSLDRLRRKIDEALRARGSRITVTIGAMTYVQAPERLDEVIRRADASLYKAKRAGKDRLVLEEVQPGLHEGKHPTGVAGA